MSRPLLLICLECLFPKAHEEDHREYAEAVKSKTKHLLLGTTHYPNFARPKPYVVKDKKTGANPTQSDIDAKRSEFWASAPLSGGDSTIWEVLKGASEAMLPKWETRDGTRVKVPGDLARARKKLSLHPFAVAKPDMTLCVDIVGFKYVLPRYVLRDPLNLQDDSTGAGTRAGDGDEDEDGDSWSEDEYDVHPGSLPAPPSRTSSLPRGRGEAIDPGGDEGGLPPVAPGMLRKKRAPRRMMSNPMA